jgi:hypothetical protein
MLLVLLVVHVPVVAQVVHHALLQVFRIAQVLRMVPLISQYFTTVLVFLFCLIRPIAFGGRRLYSEVVQ